MNLIKNFKIPCKFTGDFLTIHLFSLELARFFSHHRHYPDFEELRTVSSRIHRNPFVLRRTLDIPFARSLCKAFYLHSIVHRPLVKNVNKCLYIQFTLFPVIRGRYYYRIFFCYFAESSLHLKNFSNLMVLQILYVSGELFA